MPKIEVKPMTASRRALLHLKNRYRCTHRGQKLQVGDRITMKFRPSGNTFPPKPYHEMCARTINYI